MPEGDTVHLAATRLNAALAGEVLTKTDFRVPRWATADLTGDRVLEIVARGKHLLWRIDGGTTLHTHFKMDGEWRLFRRGRRRGGPAHEIRVVVETRGWIAVGLRLHDVELLPTAREALVVGHLGPDVLGDDWDPAEAARRMRAFPDKPLGEALLDQELIAGPGNVYKSEICFLAGIHPLTALADVDVDKVIDLTKRVMEANRSTGRQITTGDTRPGRSHWVYGRAGRSCRRCGTTIVRAEHAGYGGDRLTFWCPTCQPLRHQLPSPGLLGGPV